MSTSQPSMDPERVGPYRIGRKLGAGGMGTVYHGTHAESGVEAAVKVLTPALAREPGFVARFTREIDALKQLVNPHVVQLYESGTDGETWFYAMEYVDGETLGQRLRRDAKVGWRETIEVAVQVCSALKAAHDAGIIHRDLKPSNLMLTQDGQVKLTDFGVAQVFAAGKLTMTGGIIGTAEFMSPEQAQGQRATKKSDLYSLGAVMYTMLTGRPPFRGRTTLEVIQKHKYGQFDKPSRYADDLPPQLEQVVTQLLEKDPDKRFPDAYVLSRRLQEVRSRVDHILSEQTAATSGGFDGTAPTVASAEAQPAGMGTLMRDLVKAEVERAHRKTPVQQFFNSTWVLVALLALIVLGGVWFLDPGRREASPEERFAAGVELMEQPEGDAWITAREDHFEPLVAADPETWRPRVEPYLEKIRIYELKRDLQNGARRARQPPPQTEPERLLRLARSQRDMGDTAAARRTLAALLILLEGSPDQSDAAELARQMLEELNETAPGADDRDDLVRSALDRADRLAADGKRPDAERIWRSVIELYGPDPTARDAVQRARGALTREARGN